MERKTFQRVKFTLVREAAPHPYNAKLERPIEVFFLLQELKYADREHVVVLYLSHKHTLIAVDYAHIGSENASMVSIPAILRGALLTSASSIILAHNHPCGDPHPSNQDINLTEQLIEAGKLMGIKVLDHVIIGGEEFYSLADKGYIS
jgi:DNA repair protein RadC